MYISSSTYAIVTELERDFIRSWCSKRHLDDVYAIRALMYWIRTKNKISYSWILREENKYLYMVLCIHISLKYDGYDELYSCNFFKDLLEIYPSLDKSCYFTMEYEILSHLRWNLGL